MWHGNNPLLKHKNAVLTQTTGFLKRSLLQELPKIPEGFLEVHFICSCVCFSAVFSCVYVLRFSAVCVFVRRALLLSLSDTEADAFFMSWNKGGLDRTGEFKYVIKPEKGQALRIMP